MVLMIGSLRQQQIRERLKEEADSHGLAYLLFLFVPSHGQEGLLVEVGSSLETIRRVEVLPSPNGRAELQWPQDSSYSADKAKTLLEQLQQFDSTSLSDHLHSTICQSLTAAHLHLEFGLLSRPDSGEEFEVARGLVQEAATSVRELIEELAGGEL